jgi:hypothetical protein
LEGKRSISRRLENNQDIEQRKTGFSRIVKTKEFLESQGITTEA